MKKGVNAIIASSKMNVKEEKKSNEINSDSKNIEEEFSSKSIKSLFLFAITFNITTSAVFYGLDVITPLIDFLNQNPAFQKLFGPNGKFAKSPMGKKFNKAFGKRGGLAKFIYKVKMFLKDCLKISLMVVVILLKI